MTYIYINVEESSRMNGWGTKTYANGDEYEGNWDDGNRNGEGKYTYANGDVYVGNWTDDKRHGEEKASYVNGDVYDGHWKNGEMHGKGKYTHANGNVYEGGFKNGKMHGEGKYTYANGDVYDGNRKDDRKHGKGTKTYANGDVYDGHWKDGKRHGEGKFTFANGRVYNGNWKDGERHGEGKITNATGEVYAGNWKDGKRHGEGKITNANGEEYSGNWVDDKRHGWGEMKFANGDMYEGGFKNGKRHGEGKWTLANGAVYEGGFKNDKIHGKGKYTHANGDVYDGYWKATTIRNETDKVVYAIVTDMSPEAPPQMIPIDAHKCHASIFNLSSSYYYLTYYTKDFASGRNVYHEVNSRLEGKHDYAILPEYLEIHIDISEEDPRILLLETGWTKMDTTTPPPVAQYQEVNQGEGDHKQGTFGTGSSSTAGPGQGGQNQGDGEGKRPARDHPFINRIRFFLGMKCQSTIYNETDKAVHVVVTSRIIGTTTTNTKSININPTIGGNSVGSAGSTHTNQNTMGPTPIQMRPIPPHENRTFYLESSDYYLSYYTQDIASGRNVFHEVNVKLPGKYDYEILPSHLEVEVELAPLLAKEITRFVLPNHA